MNAPLREVVRQGLGATPPRRYRWLWQAAAPRAICEALLFLLPLFAGLIAAGVTVTGTPVAPAMHALAAPAALYAALRTRHADGSLWRQALREGAIAMTLAFALAAVYGVLVAIAGRTGWLPGLPDGSWIAVVLFVTAWFLYAGARLCVRLWFLWDTLRRRRLVFAITHVYLAIALAAALPFVLVMAICLGSSGFSRVVLSEGALPAAIVVVLLGILPAFVFLTLLVIAGEVTLIPPLALIAYVSARRVTGRLLDLARATAAIRAGDYSARVAVSGEDEVAQLQGNFNAMAAHLQQALIDLQAERDRVAELLQSRRELVANVSHELRTPVATVRAYLDSIVEAEKEPSFAQLRHDLTVMEAEVARLQGLIEDLFALSRGEVGPAALHLSPTDVAASISAAVDAVAPLAWRSSSVQVVAEPTGPLPPVLADAARLQQVLANLLRNAIGHTPPGGIVAVSARERSDGVAILVRDTGEGIAPEDLPHVWERFYHGSDAAGTGLGLAIVKEMVTSMGGAVAAASTPGEGSCFTVTLKRGLGDTEA